MNTDEITEKLIEFRKRQTVLSQRWKETGNKELLQFITDILPASLRAERCGVFLVDSDDNKVWIVSGTYLTERALLASLDGSIAGRVIKSGEPAEAKDLDNIVGEHDIAGVKTGFVTRNILCVPVRDSGGDKVIGAIQLLNKQGGVFDQRDYDTLGTLANLVRDNLEELYERQRLVKPLDEVEKHIRRLESLLIKARLKVDKGD